MIAYFAGMRPIFILLVVSIMACTSNPNDETATDTPAFTEAMYIGTYTRKEGHVDGKAAGIYYVSPEGSVVLATDDIVNPSYIHYAPAVRMVFAVSEIGGPESGGLLVGYKVEQDNSLSRSFEHPTTSAYPCHVTANKDASLIFVANYAGGVDMFSATPDSVKLLESVTFDGQSDHPRQDASHPHMALLHEASSTLYISDLGTNRVYRFKVTSGTMQPQRQSYFEMMPNAGPRHMALHPTNKNLYVLNELNSSIDVLSIDPNGGSLVRRQALPVLSPEDMQGNSTAAIRIHPSGEYLWSSNRGHNSISTFRVDEEGLLEFLHTTSTRGEFPRDINVTSDGKWLLAANQNSDNITRFRIDDGGRGLSYDGQLSVKTPVCVTFASR